MMQAIFDAEQSTIEFKQHSLETSASEFEETGSKNERDKEEREHIYPLLSHVKQNGQKRL